MKFGALILSVFFTTASFANCSTALDIASERGNLGLVVGAEASKQEAKTQGLITLNSSQKDICDSAVSTKEVAEIAANEFSATIRAFEESAKVCEGHGDEMVAYYYIGLAKENQSKNLEVAKKMDTVIEAKCF